MKPNIWGPNAWNFFHNITLEYPNVPSDKDKEAMYNFFNNVGLVLPCDKCKINYYKHLKIFPLTDDILESKQRLVYWVIDLHNIVNKSTNKKTLTYKEALKEINKNNNKQNKSNNNIIVILIILILILLKTK